MIAIAASPLRTALVALAVTVVLAFCTWIASRLRRDVSLVDRMWPILIASAASVCVLTAPAHTERAAWMLGLVLAWGLRLCAYVTTRNWGHGEDRRYQQIRARNQPRFELKSLYLIFGLQSVLAWIVAAPFLPGARGMHAFGALDVLGIVLAGFGIAFEAIGDAQMSAFKADPANHSRVMDRGLWRYTRHPNYFGEACTWWGLCLVALGGAGLAAAWSIVSPLLMTLLLLKVSGVSLLEKDITERRPAYRDYIERTPSFVPWWPRSKEHK